MDDFQEEEERRRLEELVESNPDDPSLHFQLVKIMDSFSVCSDNFCCSEGYM